MPTSTNGRMVGRVARTYHVGSHTRGGTRVWERELFRREAEDELTVDDAIAAHVITPADIEAYSTITADDFDAWLEDAWDLDDDRIAWDSPDLLDEPEDVDAIDLLSLDDRDLPGWGSTLSHDDLAGFTITSCYRADGRMRCPWGWSSTR